MATSRYRRILLAVLDAEDGRTFAERLCCACAVELGADGVGVTLLAPDREQRVVIAATSGVGDKLESAQFTLGEGPCLDATNFGRPVLEPDVLISGLTQWPGFARAALDLDVRAVFAFPLQVGQIRVGSLTTYHHEPGSLDDERLATALAYAEVALSVMLQAQGPHVEPEVLRLATLEIVDRPEVHQATGIVSVQLDIGLADALAVLRAEAFSRGRPLLDVARDVVAHRIRLDNPESS